MNENITVYRGVSNDIFGVPFDKLEGLIYREKGFKSTSLLKEKTRMFTKKDGYEMEIRVPIGSVGAYVKPISKYSHEFEFLFDAGTKFKIVKATEVEGRKKLTIEVLNDE